MEEIFTRIDGPEPAYTLSFVDCVLKVTKLSYRILSPPYQPGISLNPQTTSQVGGVSCTNNTLLCFLKENAFILPSRETF